MSKVRARTQHNNMKGTMETIITYDGKALNRWESSRFQKMIWGFTIIADDDLNCAFTVIHIVMQGSSDATGLSISRKYLSFLGRLICVFNWRVVLCIFCVGQLCRNYRTGQHWEHVPGAVWQDLWCQSQVIITCTTYN